MIIIKNQYILRNFVGAWRLGRKDPSCKESDHYGDWVRKTVNGIVQERQAGQGGFRYIAFENEKDASLFVLKYS